jgi:hypothetical protein
MIQIRHLTALILSAATWFLMGLFLLAKGLNLLVVKADMKEGMILFLIVLGLFVGFLKGRFVLSKTVKRMATHIFSLPNPSPLKKVYPLSYYLILAGMMGLGILFRWLPASIHGFVDVAVGAALMNGSLLYLRLMPKSASLR